MTEKHGTPSSGQETRAAGSPTIELSPIRGPFARRKPVAQRSVLGRAATGVLGLIVAVATAVTAIQWGNGAFDPTISVNAVLPANAGKVLRGSEVRYAGVAVGEVGGVDADPRETQLELDIHKDRADAIPANAVARVVPRTFFGDVAVELSAPHDAAAADGAISEGIQLAADTSPDAVQLYNIYTSMVRLMNAAKPDQVNSILDASATALRGNGDALGASVDRLAGPVHDAVGDVRALMAAVPEMRGLVDELNAASPSVRQLIRNAITLSETANEHPDGIGSLFAAAVETGDANAGLFLGREEQLVTFIDHAGALTQTLGGNTPNIRTSLESMDRFAQAGYTVMRTGHFTITAVPSFADPMPYTSADCPSYGDTPGVCGGALPPSAGGAAPSPAGQGTEGSGSGGSGDSLGAKPAAYVVDPAGNKNLAKMEKSVGGDPRRGPSPAMALMAGPIVRGTIVEVH
ncbi:MCE family protein [Corynebacterium hansenii]|uniref:MCE family protein n=1 Tax=Corynebacterium hansenii TaxID=394964 RepID=A0ABV7ZMU6_9CORY|nr:MCE family protein [Corynebacterium hansenii]WJZ00430.1 hypothetical protein CHAN_09115 [Corynebacterium hansenii]